MWEGVGGEVGQSGAAFKEVFELDLTPLGI